MLASRFSRDIMHFVDTKSAQYLPLASHSRQSPGVPVAVIALSACLFGIAAPATAQSAENVAIVINDSSADSQRIGEYYARQRNLPASNILRIRTLSDETIDRDTYARTIEEPIATAIGRARLHDRILYLVLTKDIPLRISGTAGASGTGASVDSELTLLYRQMTGLRRPAVGHVDNPYFLGERDVSEARPFTHKDYDIYLVSRLDAFTVEQALALVDRAAAPATVGRIVLDQRAALVNRTGETWLEEASSRLAKQGHADRVVLETTPKPARDIKPVLGYFSWGSTDPQNRVRSVMIGFAPGAIAGSFVSSDARTFHPPPDAWVPTGNSSNRLTWFAGSPESLIGDLILDGVTGVAGHVAEPLLQSVIRPQILFPAYFAGFNLIEAYYLAMPDLSWQTVVIGDPLCAPFRTRTLTRSDIEGGVDDATDLPMVFSKRRLAVAAAQSPGIPQPAIVLQVRGQALLGRGDAAGGRAALEEAVQLAPRFVAGWLQLAGLDEQEDRIDAAIDKYKRVVLVQPNNFVALNNHAYALAVRQKMPAEALPLARRAAAQAPDDFLVLDTLGWIQHLLGDDAGAAQVLG
jgi:uncharacterized protein (TIGR03790 family)